MARDEIRLFGFDLAKKQHEVVICDVQGNQLHRFDMPRGRAGWERLQQTASRWIPAGGRGVYLVEAAQCFWQEIVHPLVAQGEEVHLLHPVKCSDLRKFFRRHTKTDTIDALATARVWLTDRDLNPAWVGSPEQESLRRLCRLHWKLGEETRNLKRRLSTNLEMILPGIGKVWKNHYCQSARLFYRRYLDPVKARRLGRKRLGEVLRRRAWGKFSAAKEAELWAVIDNAPELDFLREDLQLEVACLLDSLEMLERQQAQLAERIDELYTAVDPQHRLESVPGLGPILAASIHSVIGDIARWPSADRLLSYSGLVPRKRRTGQQDKPNQPLTKHGNAQLRCWLYVASEVARHHDPQLQAYFKRQRDRGKHHKQAICALAAKLLRRIHSVLKQETGYRILAAGEKNEKPVRTSVHEVAQTLLNEGMDTASPEKSRSPVLKEQEAATGART